MRPSGDAQSAESGPAGLLPGFTSVKFDVAAPFNFSSYRYFIVFNTTENGQTPLTNPAEQLVGIFLRP